MKKNSFKMNNVLRNPLPIVAIVLLIALVIGSIAVNAATPTGTRLKNIQSRVLIGTEFPSNFNSMSDTATFTSMAAAEFNMVTPENAMKWDATEPSQNSFNYGDADRLVSWAQSNGFKTHGHTLVWHSQTPSWAQNLSASALQSAMYNHIDNVMGHFKGKIMVWDVVNEAFEENGSYRASFWYNKLGKSFIENAFIRARAADPSAKLIYNDYNLEATGSKSNGAYNMLKDLKSRGIPVDGIGFQMHLDIQYAFDYNDFANNLQRFADLGLEIYITEMDVRVSSNPSSSELQTQATYYENVIKKCMAQPAVKAIQIWGFTDKYSWVPQTFPGRDAALIFDSNYNPKPSYYAVQRALETGITVTPTPTQPGPTPTPGNGSISIAAGSTSAMGSFQADQYYSGGSTYGNSNTVDVSQITSNPPPAALFNNERYGEMSYTIPGFTAGNLYEVTLYFAETYLTSSGSRSFNVSINGATVLSNFDIYASAGGQNKAIARTFTATANSNGQIVIQFTSVTENPKINGISIKPGVSNPTPTVTPTPAGNTPTVQPSSTPTPTPGSGSISIAAGSTSAMGSFQADQYYSGGSTYSNSNTVDVSQITSNSPPAALFNNERYGAMSYTIPGFTAGNLYEVTLYFAETYLTSSGSRSFNVSINGATVLSNFDIYASAGGQNKAIARTFTATANSNGQIVIQFTSVTENPKINGISIKPGVSNPTPTVTPTPAGNTPTVQPSSTPTPTPGSGSISIAAGSTSAMGSFQADQYYSGGSTYSNSNTVDVSQITSNSPPAALFNNERYGAMSYTIPGFTAGSLYAVTLYFAETYLSSSGSRRFNVSINGATVLSNFDIYASAGGQNRAIARSFTATANSNGQIVIQFTSVTENPKINGISIDPGTAPPTPTLGPTPTPGGTAKVMPLGDSITFGSNIAGAYRTKLWTDIRNAGKNVDFVGSQNNGPTALGDKDNEGHSGWRIDQIDSSINGWMDTYNPKIVLLHIGTNDILQNYNVSSAPSRLSALIDKICAKLPAGGKLYVAQIIPLSNSGQNQNLINFNNQIPGLVQSKVSAGKPVYVVNMYSALTTADLQEGVHPNQTGYDKMGDVWFNAISNDL